MFYFFTKKFIFILPCFLPFLLKIISCVFLGFNFTLHFEHHASRSFNVFDILYCTYTLFGPNVHMPKSSANCEIFTWLLRGSIGKSLTYIKKSSGLRTVPAFNWTLSETSSFIFTDIVLLVINEDINLTIFLGRSPVISCVLSHCAIQS